MSAARHLADAIAEVKRMDAALEDLTKALHLGQRVGPSQLSALRRACGMINYHAVRAELDLAHMPQLERRDMQLPPTMGDLFGTQPEEERGIDVRDERRGLTWAINLDRLISEADQFIAEHPELKP